LVVDIKTEDEDLKSVLFLDVGIGEKPEDTIIFYQENRGNGFRGFLSGYKVKCKETGEEPAFKIPVPKSYKKEPEQLE
jgi:hypothetical protein